MMPELGTAGVHLIAAVTYFIGAGLGWRALSQGQLPRNAQRALGVGALVHVVGFVLMHAEQPPVPMESFSASISLIGWLIVVAYLMSIRFARVRGILVWVAAISGVFTLAASAALPLRDTAIPPALGGSATVWSHAHVLLSALGFSLLALATVAGLGYLLKQRALKRKTLGRLGLPSLESLDRMEHFTLAVGYALLTLGVVTGFAWGWARGLSLWTPHSFWLLLAWAVYLLPISLRVLRNQHGEQPARTVVFGFVLLAFSYIGIRLIGGDV